MDQDQAGFVPSHSEAIAGVRASYLVAALIGLVGLTNLLTLAFLGLDFWWLWSVCGLSLLALCAWLVRAGSDARVPVLRLAACCAIGLVLALLGGEGHLFYANYDWIIRDAVMQDMARAPWPYIYIGHGAPTLLRAPIGMYLLPALAGKLAGQAAMDATLAVQNGVVLGLILALGSLLFGTPRARRIALVVVIGFSGLDTLGQALTAREMLWPLTTHIEGWAAESVYLAPVSSLFWAPQHALAGWVGAVLFLLWRTDRLPLGGLLAAIPLLPIWSPLATVGILPFIAVALIETISRRQLSLRDILMPALALPFAAVPIIYLHADAASVGSRILSITPHTYILFILLEVGVWMIAVWLATRGGRFGLATFAAVALTLLLAPFVQVGTMADFAMRATLVASAVLSVLLADLLIGAAPRRAMPWLVLLFAIGALTPARELLRAVTKRPTPTLQCDLNGAWDFAFPAFPKATYLARQSHLPAYLRDSAPTPLAPLHPAHCWGWILADSTLLNASSGYPAERALLLHVGRA